jgi:hypothetical protein
MGYDSLVFLRLRMNMQRLSLRMKLEIIDKLMKRCSVPSMNMGGGPDKGVKKNHECYED